MQETINNTITEITTNNTVSFKQAILHTCKQLQIIPSKQNLLIAKQIYNEVVAMKSSGIYL